MKQWKRIYVLSLLLLAAAVAQLLGQAPAAGQAGRGGAGAAPQTQRRNMLISRDIPDSAAVERGQKVFVASCGFCHGARANGGENGPDLVRSPLALDDEGGDLVGPVILKGRPDKGMPPFQMTQEQIKDVAAFLRSRQQAAINRQAYTILNVVTGDAKKGEAYFNGAGKCSTCHSATGDLKGIASKYDPPALQLRFLYPAPSRFETPTKPPPPTQVTVTPPGGRPVTGTLEYLDDFDVSLRDSSGEYYSWTRAPGIKVEVRDPLQGHQELLEKYSDADMHNILAYLVTLK